jgi:hypothetical protein
VGALKTVQGPPADALLLYGQSGRVRSARSFAVFKQRGTPAMG